MRTYHKNESEEARNRSKQKPCHIMKNATYKMISWEALLWSSKCTGYRQRQLDFLQIFCHP